MANQGKQYHITHANMSGQCLYPVAGVIWKPCQEDQVDVGHTPYLPVCFYGLFQASTNTKANNT